MQKFVLVAVLLLVHGWSFAQDALPRYSVKQDAPDTGSNIKRDVVDGSPIPVDRKYGELSPAQQEYLRSQYEGMVATDEPPFPIDGLRPIYKAIALAQKKLMVRGSLSMYVAIDSDGKPESVSVYQSPDPKMTEAVATTLMLQKYKPAVCGGQNCKMQFPFRINFSVRL